jgi:isoleucyl-tRNA synthetase
MLELSRSYIQLTRDKASIGTERQKEIVAHTTYTVLMESLKLFAVVTPFITEKIYLNFKDAFKLKTESIHLHKWPTFDETLIDEQLERDFSISSKVIQATLHAREKAQVGVRWPLSHIRVATTNDDVQASLERSKEIILQQTNVKELLIEETFRDAKTTVKADFKQLGPDFGNKAPLIVAALAKESSQSILEKLEKDKKFVVEVNGEKCNVVKEHLIVQREVPDNYIEADFGVGQLYLSTESNEALEGEGYAREVMRRIQSLRKDNGLVKTDRISLFLKVDEELETMLQEWNRQIVDKVGAKIMKISTNNPAKTHIVSSKEKVKNHSFEIYFDKV